MKRSGNIFTRIAAAILTAIMLVCAASPAFADEADCTAGMPGDANGDGKINVNDAVGILRYAAKWQVDIDLNNADAVNDDAINVLDAILIIKYAAKWDVRLGHNDSSTVTVAATCTEGGSATVACRRCGSSKPVSTAPLGHTYKNGACVRCGSISEVYSDYYKMVDWIKIKGNKLADGNYNFVVDQTLDLYGFGEVTMFSLVNHADNSTTVTLSYLYQPDDQSLYTGTLLINPEEKTEHTFTVDYYYVDGYDIKYQHAEGKVNNSKTARLTEGYWGYSNSEMSFTTNEGALSSAQINNLKALSDKYLSTMFLEAEFDLIGSNVSLADFGFNMK